MSELNLGSEAKPNLEGGKPAEQNPSDPSGAAGGQDPVVKQQEADLAFLDENASPEEKAKAEQRAKTKEGQVTAAREAVKAGKNLKSYPDYVQEALKAEGFGYHQEVEQADESTLVKKAVEQIRQEQGFESLKEEIKAMNLTSEQKQELETEYKALRADGLDPSKALPRAIQLTSIAQEAEKKGIKFGRMALNPQGVPPTMKQPEVDPMQMSDDELLAYTEKFNTGSMINTPTP